MFLGRKERVMILTNNGEYMGEGTPADVIDEYIGGHEWYTARKPNFCPYCGADMRESEGE